MLITHSQQEYDRLCTVQQEIANIVMGFLDSGNKIYDRLDSQTVKAMRDFVHPDIHLVKNYSKEWGDLGLADWEHGTLVHVNPALVSNAVEAILNQKPGYFNGLPLKIADLIPDSALMEMDPPNVSIGLTFREIFDYMKQKAIHDAARLLKI